MPCALPSVQICTTAYSCHYVKKISFFLRNFLLISTCCTCSETKSRTPASLGGHALSRMGSYHCLASSLIKKEIFLCSGPPRQFLRFVPVPKLVGDDHGTSEMETQHGSYAISTGVPTAIAVPSRLLEKRRPQAPSFLSHKKGTLPYIPLPAPSVHQGRGRFLAPPLR